MPGVFFRDARKSSFFIVDALGFLRKANIIRAEAQAPAAADVPVAAPDGIEPVDALAQPATADSGQAAITPATDAAGVSKANAAKDLNGQGELATTPSDLSQAPTAKNATDSSGAPVS